MVRSALIGLVVAASLWLTAVAGAAPQLTSVGTFDFPIHVTAPPGDTHRLFVVERPGRVRIVKDGVTLATPFLDISSVVNPAAAAGCSRSRSRRGTPRPGSSTRSTRTPPASAWRSSGARPTRTRRARAPGASCSRSRTPPRSTTTAGSSSSTRAACSTSRSATARTAAATPRASAAGGGSCCGSTPARRGARLLGAPRQPVRQDRGRQARDLGLRPAQPVALLVRPADGGPRARGRRRGARRRDRLRPRRERRRARRELRLELLRGAAAYAGAPASCTSNPPANHVPPVLERLADRRSVRDQHHRRLRRPGRGRAVAQRALRLRGLLQRRDPVRGARHAGRHRRRADRAGVPTSNLVSFGEDGAGHVYVATRSGPVYRLSEGP